MPPIGAEHREMKWRRGRPPPKGCSQVLMASSLDPRSSPKEMVGPKAKEKWREKAERKEKVSPGARKETNGERRQRRRKRQARGQGEREKEGGGGRGKLKLKLKKEKENGIFVVR